MKKPFLFVLFASILFTYCQTPTPVTVTEVEKTSFSNFSKLDVPLESFIILTTEDQELTSSEGSTIRIKANSFLDKDGNRIEGEVNLKFREFHSIKDLIVSGVPMAHEQNGESGYLVTAGMCEIRGDYNNEAVTIDPNSPVEIDLVSKYKGNGDVEFFVLNEETGVWINTGRPTPLPDPKLEEIQAELVQIEQMEEPIEPREFDPNEPVINFNIGDPTGTLMDETLWRYAGEDLANNPLNRKEFKNKLYSIRSNREVDHQNLQVKTEFFLFEKNENDSLDIIDTVEILLAPVIFGSELKRERALFDIRYQAYLEKEKRREELQQLATQYNSVRNSFAVSNWGFFNCDVFTRNPSTNYALKIHQNNSAYENAAKLVLIRESEQEPGVLSMDYVPTGIEFKLFDEGECHLLVINGEGNVAVLKDIRNNQKFKMGGSNISVNIDQFQLVDGENGLDNILANL